VLPCSIPQVAALMAMPWPAPATMVAMMNNASVPAAIAVMMPIIPARKVIMPTRWATPDVNRPPMGAPRTLGVI
jgi:hypothetical protein